MAKRRPTKIAGLPVFTCPRRPGELRLTATTCATSHKMAQRAEEEAKVRLWECIDCPTGAKHLAALGGPKRPQTDSDLPEPLRALLKYIRTRGRCTSSTPPATSPASAPPSPTNSPPSKPAASSSASTAASPAAPPRTGKRPCDQP